MSSLFEQREAIAMQISPHVVSALEEFAKKKWAGGCLSGQSGKFRIYYQNNIEFQPEMGRFQWLVHSERGLLIKDANGYKYPTYKVTMLLDEEDNITPIGFAVRGGSHPQVEAVFSQAALKEALMEVLTKNYPPDQELSWHFEEKGTRRLK